MAKALGLLMKKELNGARPVVCLDGVRAEQGDYVDLGRPVLDAGECATLAALYDEDAPFLHPGEECVTMVQGQLYVRVNDTGYLLEEGDSLTYDSSLPHWYRNSSRHAAVLIGAMTPPSF